MPPRPEETELRRLDLNLLPVFAALMRERSVTRAGEALFLSQPATSAALARLRTVFRDELLVRNGKQLEPTARAEALLAALTPSLQAIAATLAGAVPFDPATDERVFRVGWTDDVGMAAKPLLARIWQQAPQCRLVIRAANYRTIPGMLESGEIGLALGFMGDDLPALAKQRVLRRGGFQVLRCARTKPVDLEAYCARPHVLVTPRGDLSGFADAALERLGRGRRVVLGVPEFGLLRQVLLGTELLCTVSDALVEALMAPEAGGGLAADPLPIDSPDSVLRMAWRTALDHDPAEEWLRAQVVAVLARR
ncbi:LysR family transcriptional regulator [Belnapia sp. T18]|uniref:LysR family transcriptional regulator n=1 Tax=Belnapia arida TaxID=2804533 RepID=A0ABS1U1R4_9PROT|nr:LysR family transcriptional regulator [Belnapia arida]MBL6078085.1 LysR family transcriptional regulator [Belnapia arida]